MDLLTKTQTQRHILKLEEYGKTINGLLAAAIVNLNESHRYLWSLPDDQCNAVLQQLLEDGKLEKLFVDHHYAATSLNKIQDNSDFAGQRAVDTAGRQFTVDNGVITLVVPVAPVVEPIIEPIPEDPVENVVE